MSILKSIINLIADILISILEFLPNSPLTYIQPDGEISTALAMFNWFVPVGQIIVVAELWLVSIATIYIYMVILRWIKVFSS